ncbi:hypothetical protein PybrP1_008444 [[Pythium] brassicae (nom. inval.)]|nr:hypothetical protein PybrP1_008444 [[Pythium] brassicae (nom. inval.)]
MADADFEERFLLLRDENTTLKKKKNEQEATIKRMYTKLAIIEEALKKKRQAEGSDNQQDPEAGGRASIPLKRDLDTERFINALKNENITLRRKNQTLQEKNRQLEEKIHQLKLKPRLARAAQQLAHAIPSSQFAAKVQASGIKKTHSSQGKEAGGTGKSREFQGSTLSAQVDHARKLHREAFSGELEQALKSRLVVAEKQLVKLQKENERLRGDNGASSRARLNKAKDNNDSASSDENDLSRAHRSSKSLSVEIEHLKRELRDRQAQLSIMNARYDNLESNAAAEREIQEKTLDQMEAMNRQVHKLRTQLQDANMESEQLEVKAAKAAEFEKELEMVRDQNRRIEERMTVLCESPFINDAFQRKERIDKMFDLEKQCEQQRAMISRFTDENQKLQVINRELQSNIKLIKQAKDSINEELLKVKQHLNEERNARSMEVIRAATEASAPSSKAPQRPTALTIPTEPEKRDACSSPVRMDPSPAAMQHPATSCVCIIVVFVLVLLQSSPTLYDALHIFPDRASSSVGGTAIHQSQNRFWSWASMKVIRSIFSTECMCCRSRI